MRSPGCTQGREQGGVDPEAPEELGGPLPALHVEQLGGGGVGHLGDRRAGQPVGEQVGDQQEPLGGRELRGAGRGDELVDGVERQELQPGDGVELVRPAPRRGPCP